MDNIFEKLLNIVSNAAWHKEEMNEDTVLSELDIDSLDILYIEEECNERFGVNINGKVTKDNTLGELAEIIRECKSL